MSVSVFLGEVRTLERLLVIAHIVLMPQSCSVSAEACGTERCANEE